MTDNNAILLCFKCGSDQFVIKHHISYDPEIIVDCCRSCHIKIHHRVRRENVCKYSVEEVNRLSHNSVKRRTYKRITFEENMMKNVRFMETIQYNINTGNFGYNACFQGHHGKKLYQEEI